VQNFSQAAENNKGPILAELQTRFVEPGRVLEIGSGTGQHAVYFSEQMPHLVWQPTDCEPYFESLQQNLRDISTKSMKSIEQPLYLRIGESKWPGESYDYAFTANVLHIMSATLMPAFFEVVGRGMKSTGLCCIYGPFRYHGEFTTPSNEQFDRWLKGNNPESGIRDIEIVCAQAESNELTLLDDLSMPANNQLLVFRKN
jgi:cyclopropane fatty-acyl-phospholipid synthase-like methyltransferase